MKTTLIWTVLLLVLAGTVLFLFGQMVDVTNPFKKETSTLIATSTTPLTFDQATVYTCSAGEVLAAAFKTGDTTVLEVSLPNSNPLIMLQAEAASGARYTHESGLVFWEKGGVVLVEKNGEVIFADCQVRSVAGEISSTTPASELSGTKWVWLDTTFANATTTEPNEPDDFIVTFSESDRFSANTDCNNVGGSYTQGADKAISFTEIVSTLMACAGDIKEATFVSQLSQVVSYQIRGTELLLNLENDGVRGEMKFLRQSGGV